MKKSLSLLLAIAMVFTMFSGVAFAADNGSDSKAKLYNAGVLKGSLSGDTLDDATWTRQNVTVLLSRLYDVEAEAQATAKGHTFTDVTDPYYDGFITWAVEEGLFTGHSDVRFGYNEDITAQQFAAVLLRALNVEHDYEDAVAAAIEAGILAEELDNDSAVLRGASYDILVATLDVEDEDGKSLGERLGLEGWVPEVPTIAANATNVYEVTVKFGSEIDTEKAKIALTRGSQSVSASTEWEDGNTAILNTDTRIVEGEYKVTVTGIDTELTAEFTAEDERVESLEFVNTTDTLAYTQDAVIRVAATNQYGKLASFGTSSYTALISGATPTVKKDEDGYLVLTHDITSLGSVSQGHGVVPVTVYYTNSNVTVSKNFNIGTVPILSEIQTGDVQYPEGKSSLRAENDVADIPVKFFDQYENPIVNAHFAKGEINHTNVSVVVTPYNEHIEVLRNDGDHRDFFDDEDNGRIQVQLKKQLNESIDFTVNIYGGFTPAAATVSVGSGKVPTKVEFAEFNGVIAAGDTTAKLSIIAYDANGEELSIQDIVDSYDDGRFIFSVTNGDTRIIRTGGDKGKLELYNLSGLSANHVVYVSAQIKQSLTNTYVQKSISVSPERYPDRITVKDSPAAKAILGAGDKVVYELKDQYGENIKSMPASVKAANGQNVQYQVAVEINISGDGMEVVHVTDEPIAADEVTTIYDSLGTTSVTFDHDELKHFNKGFVINTEEDKVGKATIRATIQRNVNGAGFSDHSATVTRSLEAIKSDTPLTFSLDSVGDIYAAIDGLDGVSVPATFDQPLNSKFAKKLEVKAKDNAGNSVKLPDNMIQDVTSSNETVFETGSAARDGYVLGNKAGSATVTAIVYSNVGTTLNLTQDVTVKSDAIVVQSVKGDESSADYVPGNNAIDYFGKLTVETNYGYKFEDGEIATYDALLRVRYTVKVVQGDGEVTMSSTGNISGHTLSVGDEFEITATSSNGKSATVLVAIK